MAAALIFCNSTGEISKFGIGIGNNFGIGTFLILMFVSMAAGGPCIGNGKSKKFGIGIEKKFWYRHRKNFGIGSFLILMFISMAAAFIFCNGTGKNCKFGIGIGNNLVSVHS
jgi:hypothetical protein